MFGKCFYLVVVLIVFALTFSACTVVAPQATQVPEPTDLSKVWVIGNIYVSPVEIPWSRAHKEALKNALANYGTVTEINGGFEVHDKARNLVARTLSWTATDDFSTEKVLSVAQNMIQQGANTIFVTAEDWCAGLISDFASEHPNVLFACIRSETAPNVVSMYPKSWMGFCIAGAALAAQVESPHIGLLGAYENNSQVASNHGAAAACFADAWTELGKPGVPEFSTVYVNSWGDSPKEHEAARALVDMNVSAFLVHEDSTSAAQEVAQDQNPPLVVGYDQDWAQFVEPNKHVFTSVTIDWTDVYSKVLAMAKSSDFDTFRWNPGLSEGAVKLAPFSPVVTDLAKQLALKYTQKLADGWRPCGDDNTMWSIGHWTDCYKEGSN
ncbi:hypothetical protein COV24_04680 [candidate division WWE3 bacterium CG10_big_fil_rev_8_21_14_0_10_32_10]|uniref:ABC transporter substrate-binding protein PnrA-like domain-containing protein n=1 Tax=candidate division WWE3 bacterium CG10_big_fil_rev_8_21_14_0_10_32_10 TaxID=1975090 RepID=A0A2H0R9E6_UNCKA|nr:MAG: hypothetical protein COV24_04680 [candidate division WWE3 bacterium CG10_big_fil_rev_8_21_14_0_10_32_10]